MAIELLAGALALSMAQAQPAQPAASHYVAQATYLVADNHGNDDELSKMRKKHQAERKKLNAKHKKEREELRDKHNKKMNKVCKNAEGDMAEKCSKMEDRHQKMMEKHKERSEKRKEKMEKRKDKMKKHKEDHHDIV